jgi:hypothetical protein
MRNIILLVIICISIFDCSTIKNRLYKIDKYIFGEKNRSIDDDKKYIKFYFFDPIPNTVTDLKVYADNHPFLNNDHIHYIFLNVLQMMLQKY